MQPHRFRPLLSAALLALVMAATRYQHFGDALHLPDASLAVFFLAGLLTSSALVFPALLLEAGLIDALAIGVGGVSDYCVTPAYGFLVPAYGVLWLAGRWLAARHATRRRVALPALYAVLLVAVSAAFLISNTGFYAYSGRVPGLTLADYATAVAGFFPPYALGAFGYVTVTILLHAIATRAGRAPEPDRG